LVGRKQKNKIEKTLKEIDWRYVAKITETNLQKNFKEVLINSSARLPVHFVNGCVNVS